MPWAEHASQQHRQIIESGPAHFQFSQVATFLLIQAAKKSYKMTLPSHQQSDVDHLWNSLQVARRSVPGVDPAYVWIEEHIREVVSRADAHIGHRGQDAVDWMNDVANGLVAAIRGR